MTNFKSEQRIKLKTVYIFRNQTCSASRSFEKNHWYTEKRATDDLIEEIEEDIRDIILDLCLGWEKAMNLEHKEIEKMRKNLIIKKSK